MNTGLSIDRARSLLRAALDLSMTFNRQPIHLRIEDCCSEKPDHLCLPANENSGGGANARIFNASLGGQGDEGFSIAFGTTFRCNTDDPVSQEEVDNDPVGRER